MFDFDLRLISSKCLCNRALVFAVGEEHKTSRPYESYISILDVNLRYRGHYHDFIPSAPVDFSSFLHHFAPCFLNCGNGPKSYIKVRSDYVS